MRNVCGDRLKTCPSTKRMSKAFPELDRDCWFGEGRSPTISEIVEHCRRINKTAPKSPSTTTDVSWMAVTDWCGP